MSLKTLENIVETFEKIGDIDDKTRMIIEEKYDIACLIREELYNSYPILAKTEKISKTKTWRTLLYAHNQLVHKFHDNYWYLNPINEKFIIEVCTTPEEVAYIKKLSKHIKYNKYYNIYLHYHFLPINVQQQMECLEKIEQLIDLFQLRINNTNEINKVNKKGRAA